MQKSTNKDFVFPAAFVLMVKAQRLTVTPLVRARPLT